MRAAAATRRPAATPCCAAAPPPVRAAALRLHDAFTIGCSVGVECFATTTQKETHFHCRAHQTPLKLLCVQVQKGADCGSGRDESSSGCRHTEERPAIASCCRIAPERLG